MNSGVCGEAALELGYTFVGVEIVPRIFEKAMQRLGAERRLASSVLVT